MWLDRPPTGSKTRGKLSFALWTPSGKSVLENGRLTTLQYPTPQKRSYNRLERVHTHFITEKDRDENAGQVPPHI